MTALPRPPGPPRSADPQPVGERQAAERATAGHPSPGRHLPHLAEERGRDGAPHARGGPTALAPEQARGWGRGRRTAFVAWAALLSLLLGSTFTGVTALTIGLWLVDQNADTTPVTDLGFFALGAIIIATGLAVQLRAPERHIAGLQQAVIGLLALGVAGLIGDRVEPLAGAGILLVATALLVALHPARRTFFTIGSRPSIPLAALALLAALPAAAYAGTMLVQARQAGPSCFLGRCAYGDRFAELAALAIATVAVGLLAAGRPPGWRVSAWSAGAAAAIVGAASVAWPELAGALGRAAGAAAVLWGVLFVAVAEWEQRQRTGAAHGKVSVR